MALKDDAQLVATIAAILLTRHNHPLEGNIKSVLTTAVQLLDAAENAGTMAAVAAAAPVALVFPDGTQISVPANSPWPFDMAHGGQSQPPK